MSTPGTVWSSAARILEKLEGKGLINTGVLSGEELIFRRVGFVIRPGVRVSWPSETGELASCGVCGATWQNAKRVFLLAGRDCGVAAIWREKEKAGGPEERNKTQLYKGRNIYFLFGRMTWLQ